MDSANMKAREAAAELVAEGCFEQLTTGHSAEDTRLVLRALLRRIMRDQTGLNDIDRVVAVLIMRGATDDEIHALMTDAIKRLRKPNQ